MVLPPIQFPQTRFWTILVSFSYTPLPIQATRQGLQIFPSWIFPKTFFYSASQVWISVAGSYLAFLYSALLPQVSSDRCHLKWKSDSWRSCVFFSHPIASRYPHLHFLSVFCSVLIDITLRNVPWSSKYGRHWDGHILPALSFSSHWAVNSRVYIQLFNPGENRWSYQRPFLRIQNWD